MKNVFAFFVILFQFAFVSSSFAQNSVPWKHLEYKEGNFKVSLPGEIQKEISHIGKREMRWFQVLTNQYFFAVNYSDHKNRGKNSTNKETYDYFEKQLEEQFGKKIKSKRNISVNELEGREIVLEMLNERSLIRMFIVGDRVYHNVVIMRVSDFESEKMQSMISKFFDSFSLLRHNQ